MSSDAKAYKKLVELIECSMQLQESSKQLKAPLRSGYDVVLASDLRQCFTVSQCRECRAQLSTSSS